MKICIRRHQSDYHVFRALAIAQAIAKASPGAEISIECFTLHQDPIGLAPSVKWKNPHHPFEVSERKTEQAGKPVVRPGGKIYGQVIDIDGDGPFEARWMKSGLTWYEWALSVVKVDFPELAPARFPTIESLMLPATIDRPYILLAPLANEADPRDINANNLEAYARRLFPEAAVFWISPANTPLGSERILARWDSHRYLAGWIRNAEAVFTVNGIVAALAQSTFEEKLLAKQLYFVRGRPPEGPVQFGVHRGPRGERQVFAIAGHSTDGFAKMRSLIDTEPAAGGGQVLHVHPETLELGDSPWPPPAAVVALPDPRK